MLPVHVHVVVLLLVVPWGVVVGVPVPLWSNTFDSDEIGVDTLAATTSSQWVATSGTHNGVYTSIDGGGGVVFSGPTIPSLPFTIRLVVYLDPSQPTTGNGYQRIFEMTSAERGVDQITLIQNQFSGDLVVALRGADTSADNCLHLYTGLWNDLLGAWHDLVMVVTDPTQADGSGIRLYVDGSIISQASDFSIFPGGLHNPELAFEPNVHRDIYLGLSSYGGDTMCNAQWDEFEIYSSALSGSDIAAIYANDAVAQGSANGDPMISGLQGQSFQYHGIPNEVFNLITTPHLHINSRFVYLEQAPSGKCTYNETTCWSHPGTYLKEIGFIFPGHTIHVMGNIHSRGLTAVVDNFPVNMSDSMMFPLGNETRVVARLMDSSRVLVMTPSLDVMVVNSDGFVNLEVTLKDHSVRQAGEKPYQFKHTRIKDDVINAQVYPEIPLHGLIGQTWRNAVYGPARTPYEGDKDSYLVSSGDLFGTDSEFSYYQH